MNITLHDIVRIQTKIRNTIYGSTTQLQQKEKYTAVSTLRPDMIIRRLRKQRNEKGQDVNKRDLHFGGYPDVLPRYH